MAIKRRRQNGNGAGMFEVNMTPLIDVSLVLVVMLLLATPLALESSIMVKKTEKAASEAAKKTDDERVELRVVSAETVLVNRRAVDRRDLTESLKPLLNAGSRPLVVIGCDNGVTHGTFVDVLDRVKLAGSAEIAVTGE